MRTNKYAAFPRVDLPDRQWPEKTITQAPSWCSVDLRDGNQSLRTPMNLEEKLEFFQLLVNLGFKEIEVGFPGAAEVEYQFVRKLIEDDLIPDDVYIQVLTQARYHLIEKTFDSLAGAKRAIYHLYNSTSTLQRDVVFKMSRKEIVQLAVDGTREIKAIADRMKDLEIVFEYSPESFTGTELDFALEICEAVMDVWQPTPDNKAIINLPATVEMSTPNIFADMIEWFSLSYSRRDSIILSVHTHNDRGTGVAATELALMAGAERVEGTLFGCGERTGNVDIVTLALNLFSQGIDPGLSFHDINQVAEIFEKCTRMPLHPRHPYVGELVYTAFSGSHQDAIKKGMDMYDVERKGLWAVPYLPIDPRDVGRTYEKIIQINSQSGKGGVAYVMEQQFGFKLPKAMHPELGEIVQKETDKTGDEVLPPRIFELFENEYLKPNSPFEFKDCEIQTRTRKTSINATLVIDGEETMVSGEGNGPLDAMGSALKQANHAHFKLISYSEHALDQTTSSRAAAYIQIEAGPKKTFGVGIDPNISIASIKALISALNRISIGTGHA
ncbi:MAG: 2-isopropylmalate synthase [Proteobacteria bacterium]|nr:2-isopropylmalate synthase [Pseudomonadota bacterium]